jgi:hypothetical protein
MSTKTTFKRIALVAVAALGFGTLSVAPSSAVPQIDTLTASALTATAMPGAAASVTLSHTYLSTGTSDTVTATVSIQSMPAGNTVLPVLASVTTNDTGSPTKVVSGFTASTGSVAASTAVRGDYTLSLTTLTVGTYVFKVTPQAGSMASALTLTYTIADTATAPTATASRVYMQTAALNGQGSSVALLLDGNGYEQVATYNVAGSAVSYSQATLKTNLGTHIATQDASASNVTTLSVVGGAATAGNTVASFGLILGNGDTITASTITGGVQNNAAPYAPNAGYYFNAAGYPVTVTVTGPGLITYEGVVKGKSFTEASTNANYLQKSYSLLSDGATGVSTITFTQGAVTLATRTVNFYGAAAKITPTVVNSVLKIGANTGAITAVLTDANGTPVPGVTVYASSNTDATIDDAYVASTAVSSATGAVTFDLTGVAKGTATITLTLNSTSAGTSTVSAVAGTMRVSDGVATKVDYTFDKDSYAPGAAAVVKATVSNADGVMPAGTYTVLTAAGVTANYTISGLPAATVLAVGSTGAATYTVTIPVGITGDLQLAGTSSATTIAATFGKATIVNAAQDTAQAAVDAAAEAIDAANAATDAANAAAEAADAATAAAQDAADAVAALSVSVAAMIDSLKKQITALTNLVIKIQKKVKA